MRDAIPEAGLGLKTEKDLYNASPAPHRDAVSGIAAFPEDALDSVMSQVQSNTTFQPETTL